MRPLSLTCSYPLDKKLTICYKRNRNWDTWKGVKEEKVAEFYNDGGLEMELEKAMAPHSLVLLPGNSMDRGAWWAAVHGVAKSWTWLSDFPFTFHFRGLEKEMATHSSVLAWRISGTGEPGGLPSMGSHRVGHDWSDLAAGAAEMESKGTGFWRKHC